MTLDWTAFTPGPALAGGVLIGLAAGMFVLLNGRIAGISGILGGLRVALMRSVPGDRAWRIAFLAGLIAAPLLWQLFTALPPVRIDAGYGLLAVAGLLVGVGTRYGAGCTSGHGVCGVSRLSLRSVVATVVFMVTGFGTVLVVRHLLPA